MKKGADLAIGDAALQLRAAAEARKCWSCGCFHGALASIEGALPAEEWTPDLRHALTAGRERLAPVRYDCLGCELCFPAIAMNALGVGADSCPTEPADEREGWPPLPGSYTVLRFRAPVAICTLTDEPFAQEIVAAVGEEVAIVGTLQTENLGIERLIRNVLANPAIRFLVLCGEDSRQAVGHLPGQSLTALAASGVDPEMRIIGAGGKRPRLRNLDTEAIEHFRNTVEIVDRIGERQLAPILEIARDAADRDPGPAAPFYPEARIAPVRGYLPERMVGDPAGYFVLDPDFRRGLIVLEHYRNDGVLDALIEGRTAAELYTAAIHRDLVSRLDHAAYLGCELARAERALQTGDRYHQDRAAERAGERAGSAGPTHCGCDGSCGESGA